MGDQDFIWRAAEDSASFGGPAWLRSRTVGRRLVLRLPIAASQCSGRPAQWVRARACQWPALASGQVPLGRRLGLEIPRPAFLEVGGAVALQSRQLTAGRGRARKGRWGGLSAGRPTALSKFTSPRRIHGPKAVREHARRAENGPGTPSTCPCNPVRGESSLESRRAVATTEQRRQLRRATRWRQTGMMARQSMRGPWHRPTSAAGACPGLPQRAC